MNNFVVLSTGIIINLDAVAFIFPVGTAGGSGEDRGVVIVFSGALDNNDMMISGPDADLLLKHLEKSGLDVKVTREKICGPLTGYAAWPKAARVPKKIKGGTVRVHGL